MDTTLNKPATVSILTAASTFMAAIMAKVRAAVEAQAPVGYEDEAGFHYGSPDFKN